MDAAIAVALFFSISVYHMHVCMHVCVCVCVCNLALLYRHWAIDNNNLMIIERQHCQRVCHY